MKNFFRISILCCLLLYACSSEEEPAQAAVGEIKFSPIENTDVEPGEILQLNFETSEIFGCINYPLLVSESFSNATLSVKFLGIGELDGCYTALGPAEAYVGLPEETELLKLVQEGRTDLYEVTVTEEKVELTKLEASFSILEQRLLLRKQK